MKRNLQIDFLRCCGVLLVMSNHNIILGVSHLDNFLQVIKTGGWIGVDLFFVLSGYLVSGLIFREDAIHQSFNAKRFLIRRGFKIYPSYYLFLLLSFFLFSHLVHHQSSQTIKGLFHEAIFVGNYFSYNNIHLWSISIEEQFYIFLSILLFFLIKFRKVELSVFLFLYLFLLVIGVVFRLYNYLQYNNYDFYRDYAKSHFRFDALFFGVLLSYLANYKRDLIVNIAHGSLRFLLLFFSIAFLFTNFIFEKSEFRIMSVINLAVNPICFGYLMLYIISIKNNFFLKTIAPFAYIGRYSYSIYLFHKVFAGLAIHFIKNGGFLFYLSYFISAIIGGILISKAVEYPLIAIRDKYFPSRASEPKVLYEKV